MVCSVVLVQHIIQIILIFCPPEVVFQEGGFFAGFFLLLQALLLLQLFLLPLQLQFILSVGFVRSLREHLIEEVVVVVVIVIAGCISAIASPSVSLIALTFAFFI